MKLLSREIGTDNKRKVINHTFSHFPNIFLYRFQENSHMRKSPHARIILNATYAPNIMVPRRSLSEYSRWEIRNDIFYSGTDGQCLKVSIVF